MKSAKITACTFKKSFSSQHGTFYSHAITLDNGDSGEINAKEEMPAFLAQGQTLWYEKIDNGKYAPKIKRMKAPDGVQENGQQNSNVKDEVYEHISQLQIRIEKLEEVVKQLVKHTKMAYVAPKPQPEAAKPKQSQPRAEMASQAASNDLDRRIDDNSSNDDLPF